MNLISIPVVLSQSGIAIHTRPSGMPEEKDKRTTDAVRQDFNASDRLLNVDGFSVILDFRLLISDCNWKIVD
jgi:hypothetical protein